MERRKEREESPPEQRPQQPHAHAATFPPMAANKRARPMSCMTLIAIVVSAALLGIFVLAIAAPPARRSGTAHALPHADRSRDIQEEYPLQPLDEGPGSSRDPLRHPLLTPAVNVSAVGRAQAFSINPNAVMGVQPLPLNPYYRGVPMYVHDPKECIISNTILNGGWEPKLIRGVVDAALALPGEYMMDIGANIGTYTLSAAAAGIDTISFEPMKYNTEILAASVGTFKKRGGGTVNLFKTALATNATGETACVVRNGAPSKKKVGTNQGNGQIQNSTSCADGWESSELVPMNHIDGVLKEAFEGRPYPCVSSLKIDIEGFEEAAMRGANSIMLGKCPPCHIQLEYVAEYAYAAARRAGKRFFLKPGEVNKHTLLDMLHGELGYQCYHYGTGPRRERGPKGWFDGDWVCRMEDYVKHPRCKKLKRLPP
mmetsp:Transcript_25015/g.48643  ORF Transcript_25015/g.48643 Transcript_25015/m.48643 type:complete len:428 (-) Transcript_25015:154-1437(-)